MAGVYMTAIYRDQQMINILDIFSFTRLDYGQSEPNPTIKPIRRADIGMKRLFDYNFLTYPAPSAGFHGNLTQRRPSSELWPEDKHAAVLIKAPREPNSLPHTK